ncbi:hypothetical protein NLX83_07810 [Allokutzneria sp. A3M-2-11 16]|uniref:AMIN-like domain-containing (lipo)protein n=1 Tax=Allokutzneria sp. A3M-2-11 16 TaxID=2962043 RepID=UPI0020B88611|nr:hypothetical protein [Allokutzneria sp. A3M-2-11 16]MCP3799158.1 hypothetical protein [Allokutzneria sp. A3M-2-11 16]
MTSLLSRLAAGGALIAALGAGVAPIANAAPAPAAANCTEGNSLKDVFHSADKGGIGVVFNYNCKVEGSVREVAYLPAGEKPGPVSGEGKLTVKGKAFIRVSVDGINVTQNPYTGPSHIPGEGAVQEIVYAGTSCGQSTWYIGVDKKRDFVKTVKGKTVNVTVKV